MSPAQLMNITREAGMLALRSGDDLIKIDHLVRGLERVAVGLESGVRLSSEERRIVAYHECGHAIAAMAFDAKREIRKVSILGTHGNLGYTWNVPIDEWHLRSEEEYRSAIKIALGGLAAERVVFGTATDGARGDLQVVGDIVQRMVRELGMGGVLHAAPPASEALRQHQDQEMRRLSDGCFSEVTALLQSRRSLLDRMATELLASEVLTGDDLRRLSAAA
jgi:cell division protease FtsH